MDKTLSKKAADLDLKNTAIAGGIGALGGLVIDRYLMGNKDWKKNLLGGLIGAGAGAGAYAGYHYWPKGDNKMPQTPPSEAAKTGAAIIHAVNNPLKGEKLNFKDLRKLPSYLLGFGGDLVGDDIEHDSPGAQGLRSARAFFAAKDFKEGWKAVRAQQADALKAARELVDKTGGNILKAKQDAAGRQAGEDFDNSNPQRRGKGNTKANNKQRAAARAQAVQDARDKQQVTLEDLRKDEDLNVLLKDIKVDGDKRVSMEMKPSKTPKTSSIGITLKNIIRGLARKPFSARPSATSTTQTKPLPDVRLKPSRGFYNRVKGGAKSVLGSKTFWGLTIGDLMARGLQRWADKVDARGVAASDKGGLRGMSSSMMKSAR